MVISSKGNAQQAVDRARGTGAFASKGDEPNTSDRLRELLFDEIEKLRTLAPSINRATAIAKVANAILAIKEN